MNGKIQWQMVELSVFPFPLLLSLPFFSYRYFYTCCIGLSMYTKFFFCFPLHTQYHFNAVVASCMQPKYRWIFLLCCKHQYDAQRSHTLWQSRIGYDCNWIRSKSITIEKIMYWKSFFVKVSQETKFRLEVGKCCWGVIYMHKNLFLLSELRFSSHQSIV